MSVDEVTSLARYLYDLESIQDNSLINDDTMANMPLDSLAVQAFTSLSASETSASFSETDRLLRPSTPNYSTIPKTTRSPNFTFFFKHVYTRFVEQQQLHTHIRFEDWSLFYFSPKSLSRYYLWKVIGSRFIFNNRGIIPY